MWSLVGLDQTGNSTKSGRRSMAMTTNSGNEITTVRRLGQPSSLFWASIIAGATTALVGCAVDSPGRDEEGSDLSANAIESPHTSPSEQGVEGWGVEAPCNPVDHGSGPVCCTAHGQATCQGSVLVCTSGLQKTTVSSRDGALFFHCVRQAARPEPPRTCGPQGGMPCGSTQPPANPSPPSHGSCGPQGGMPCP